MIIKSKTNFTNAQYMQGKEGSKKCGSADCNSEQKVERRNLNENKYKNGFTQGRRSSGKG